MSLHPDALNLFKSISSARPAMVRTEFNLGTLPHAALSYAIAGEDLALRKLMKPLLSERHLYVDIGCFTPACASNTYLFYCMGWRGLCVDANAELAQSWKQIRPEDIFIGAAVGEMEGTVRLQLHPTNYGMHRLETSGPLPEHTDGPTVPMRRLDALFREHIGERPIALMSMDIEGSEMSALRSNDWARWRPEWIIIEAIGCDVTQPRSCEAIAYLMDQGYRIEGKISDNVILTTGGQ